MNHQFGGLIYGGDAVLVIAIPIIRHSGRAKPVGKCAIFSLTASAKDSVVTCTEELPWDLIALGSGGPVASDLAVRKVSVRIETD